MEPMSNMNEMSTMPSSDQTMNLSARSSMGVMGETMTNPMCPMNHQGMMGGANHLSIGMTAPDFTAKTTFGTMKMSDYKGKWLVFFSHPGDFTPVALGQSQNYRPNSCHERATLPLYS